jgi:DNA-binding Lrp family transcriptional regulator
MREASISHLRVAARLANGFALDLVKLGGYGRDIVDGLLIGAISQANVATITRSPELQRRYATLDAVPPDDLRRPVSINAVATSLRMPFETARRRIAQLAEGGVVLIGPRGVIIPNAPLTSPAYRARSDASYELVRVLYRRLSALGLFDDLVRAPAAFSEGERPVRLVIRLSTDYLMRLAEPVTQHVGDLVTGIILMDVIHANTEHLPDEADPQLIPGPLPDEMRRPVRAAALAARLGIAQETVRRHLNRLVETDRCERTDAGYLVPARVLTRDQFTGYVLANQVHVHRLFQALADLGVLGLWDREASQLRGAA